MKHRLNENGMALITVLLIIVLFSILGMSLFNYTVSSAKQINKNELDMQATDLAEMGVVRYKNEAILFIKNVLTADIEQAIAAIESYNASNPLSQKKIDGKTIINEMKYAGKLGSPNIFEIGINPTTNFYVSDNTRYFYNISENVPIPNSATFPLEVEIHFSSTGITLDDKATITGVLTLNIESIINKSLVRGTLSGDGLLIEPPNITIETPAVNKNCSSTTKLENNCNHTSGVTINGSAKGITAIVNGPFINTQNQEEILNSHILVNGDLEFNVNHNNITGSKLFVTGEGTFNNVNSGIFDSTVYFGQGVKFGQMNSGSIINSNFFAKGPANFENINGGLENSNLYFGSSVNFGNMNTGGVKGTHLYAVGTLTIENINAGLRNSKIYTGGNLNFGQMNNGGITGTTIHVVGNLTMQNINAPINNQSTIYVEGNLTTGNMNSAVSSDSLVCVGGKITGGLKDKENGINVISQLNYPTEYALKCPSSFGGSSGDPTTLNDLAPEIATMVEATKLNYN